jgi:hypothetical protein
LARKFYHRFPQKSGSVAALEFRAPATNHYLTKRIFMPSTTTSSPDLPPAEASVVLVGRKKCKPFLIEVMVFSPEAGFRFEVAVERECTPENDSIWKIVFDLFKQKANGNGFDQIVHVSYRGKSADENRGIAKMVDGVSPKQADVIIDKVFPATKKFGDNPTDANKAAVAEASRKVALSAEV